MRVLFRNMSRTPGIYHKVDITLTVTLLRIREGIVSLAVFQFHDRKGTKALAQHCYFAGMNGNLPICVRNT